MTPWLEEAHRAFRGDKRSVKRAPDQSLEGVVHFAACQDNQYAYEMDGAGNFTRVAIPALRTAVSGRETNESFLTHVAQQVAALGHPQTPMLMKLPSALEGRLVLTPPARTGIDPLPLGVSASSGDELLYHLQAAIRLAQQQA